MTLGTSVVSGHDAGQSHYILILVCVCVGVRMLRVISHVLKKYASNSVCVWYIFHRFW